MMEIKLCQLEVDQLILRSVLEQPGISQYNLINGILPTFSEAYVRYRLRYLKAKGLIRIERQGNKNLIFLEEVSP